MAPSPAVALAIAVGLGVVLFKRTRHHRPPLPPGPPADPIIGHLRKVQIDGMTLYELGKTYGDVIYVEMLGQPIVVLNSAQAAVDLLERRSANYSDRPRFHIYEIMAWNHTLTFTGYGKVFQRYRKLLQEYFKPSMISGYHPMQALEARRLLQNILSDEQELDKWLRRFSTSIIMQVTYGHEITSNDDPYMDISDKTSHALGNAGPPGGTPIDLFPFLRYMPSWFPGTYYAEFARSQKGAIDALHNYPFDQVVKELAEGKAKPSFLSQTLESLRPDEAKDPEIVREIKGTAGVTYCAGAETSWTTLSFFFLAMMLHPECQKQAQQEIDSIIGSGRLPEFSDRETLPYVECIFQETFRWNPVVPLGVPHRSMEDDLYRGMFIPKGSLMIANARAMALDESVYQSPHVFDPSRYLSHPQGRSEPHPIASFGFGRRICPGRHLADASVWIAIACVLATFDIQKPIGPNGKEITPEVTLSNGITSQPSPFQCRIRPRHDRARELILQDLEY